MTTLIPYDFGSLRVRVLDKDGAPWFVAIDICRALDLNNITMALRVLDPDEKGFTTVETPGGPQAMAILSEPGFYKLNGRSRKPKAKELDRYIRHTVLPTWRETGGFNVAPRLAADVNVMLSSPAQLRVLLLGYIEQTEAANRRIAELQPSVDALGRLTVSRVQVYSMQQAAKLLLMRPTEFIRRVREAEFTYHRANGDVAKQHMIDRKFLEQRMLEIPSKTAVGGKKWVSQVLVTQKGLVYIARKLGRPYQDVAVV